MVSNSTSSHKNKRSSGEESPSVVDTILRVILGPATLRSEDQDALHSLLSSFDGADVVEK